MVAHMNWKQELGRRMVSAEGGQKNKIKRTSMQLLASPLDGEPKTCRPALTKGYDLS